MAQKGARDYKKALAFCLNKWNIEKLEPKYSGDSIDDVIEYVRKCMYKDITKKKTNNDESGSESEKEDMDEVAVTTVGDNVESAKPTNLPSNGVTTIGDNVENVTPTKTATVNENHDDVANDEIIHTSDGNESNASNDSDDVPSHYIFPSFFVFVLWGPFVPSDQRLNLLLTISKDKIKGKGSRDQDRKKELNSKRDDAATDMTAVRGFSTEHRIEIENLNVRKQ